MAWVNDDRILIFGWTISLGAVDETHPVLTCVSLCWWSPGGPGADSFAWGPSHWWWGFLVYGRETPSRAPVLHTLELPHPERKPGNEANLYFKKIIKQCKIYFPMILPGLHFMVQYSIWHPFFRGKLSKLCRHFFFFFFFYFSSYFSSLWPFY